MDEKRPFLEFKGPDIKDLIVHDEDTSAPAPAPQQQSGPPARKENKQKPQAQKESQQHAERKPQAAPAQRERAAAPAQKQSAADAKPSVVGSGDHLMKLKARGQTASSNVEAVDGDFDLQKGLSVFNKSEELSAVATENPAVAMNYKKDDFFDSLSCDVLDRQEGRKTRVTGAEERAQNMDTFGATALQSNYRRHRGGGRGRGKGRRGRGGGRGRGRGEVTA